MSWVPARQRASRDRVRAILAAAGFALVAFVVLWTALGLAGVLEPLLVRR